MKHANSRIQLTQEFAVFDTITPNKMAAILSGQSFFLTVENLSSYKVADYLKEIVTVFICLSIFFKMF
jgi:hypothetical protein